ncbi:hypothetical protein XENTR_v10017578 [Xenopus tropicalis]|uniref:Potassium channel, two pore domain subfamily K, member 18 n=1 Tax=Xenopus tropicalis TaxID=8364 RepID=F7AEN8_XENTR|nr:hypothetical protein XENTR_v10017578 [Xenopus tropicalis]
MMRQRQKPRDQEELSPKEKGEMSRGRATSSGGCNKSQLICGLWGCATISDNGSAPEIFKELAREAIITDLQVEWLQKPEEQWSFKSSLFFCCTVFTTVGYGHICPVTMYGKLACMVYATLGIPLMLLLLADLGDILARLLSRTYKRAVLACNKLCHKPKPIKLSSLHKEHSGKSSLLKTMDSRVSMKEPLNITEVIKTQASVKRKYLQMRNIDIFELIIVKENQKVLPLKSSLQQKSFSCPDLDLWPPSDSAMQNFDKIGEELDHLDVPIVLIVLVMVAYIMCGACILPLWEDDWTTIDAFYFCFVTLTTIGFGDIIPKHPNYFLLLSAYTVVGMVIVCMAFKLGQNRLVSFYKQCILCISGGNIKKYSKTEDVSGQ